MAGAIVILSLAVVEAPRAGDRWRPPRTLGVPVAELPPPHACRVWRPDQPPARQAPSQACDAAWSRAPAGSWILDRTDRDHVRVYVVGEGAGRVDGVAVFDALRGNLLRELPS
jgi:hypothetical protein